MIISQKSKIALPSPGEITDSLVTNRKDGVLVVPPGAVLCRLLKQSSKRLSQSWILKQLQVKLPKLLVEDMELAESVEKNVNDNNVFVEAWGSMLDEVCRRMANQPRTHKLVGYLLSSSITCALAKTSGNPS